MNLLQTKGLTPGNAPHLTPNQSSLRAVKLTLIVLLATCIGIAAPQTASADGGSFEPVWRMLTREQRQQFVAGYLNGMRDAARMTDVLQELSKQAEKGEGANLAAGGSLDRLSQIYSEIGRSSPEIITEGINAFYADPKNQGAQLSAAITAAQASRTAQLLKEER